MYNLQEYQYYLNRILSLKSLTFKKNYHFEFYEFKNEFNELNFPKINQCFTNLTELVFTTDERKNEIFSLLSQTCHNIQKMIIRVKYQVFVGCGIAIDRSKNNTLEEAKQVASLIRSQHNLIYFELFVTHQEGMSEILKSLKETQHNSLKTFDF
ncbi:hypothetical protein C1645_834558 [Glomus cerebriforme]|uniref:Uncharacterized protein n=1 Tax=Glomus cerebriforme TaxID=658196 RepID=A0A397SK53_9GLOM|nr:hypothetical protein C1645_834558 [Glomus cerebriforme]